MRKRNKAYRPRQVPVPVVFRFGKDEERDLQLIPHAELLKLSQGLGDSGSWHTLVARLNLGMVLANECHPKEAISAMGEALEAMRSMARRHDEIGKYGATGEELKAIGAGLDLTDEMQLIATRRQLRDALTYVYKVAGARV